MNVVPHPPRLPLAPFTDDCDHFLVALRPRVPKSKVLELLPSLRRLGEELHSGGAKLYLMSIELPCADFARRQFGAAYEELCCLKRKYDPELLLNPGLLPAAAQR